MFGTLTRSLKSSRCVTILMAPDIRYATVLHRKEWDLAERHYPEVILRGTRPGSMPRRTFLDANAPVVSPALSRCLESPLYIYHPLPYPSKGGACAPTAQRSQHHIPATRPQNNGAVPFILLIRPSPHDHHRYTPPETLKPSPSHQRPMSSIPATVATTALVSDAPPGSMIGHFALVYDAARLGERVRVDPHSVIYPGAVLGEAAHLGSHTVVYQEASIGKLAHLGSHSVIGRGAVVGDGAVLGDGAALDPGCHLGAGSYLGPGARLLDRTRLPGSEPGEPARVGDGTRVGGNAVVCGGITVGAGAVVAAGESEEVQGDLEGRVEDDVPEGGVWMGGRLAAVDEGREW